MSRVRWISDLHFGHKNLAVGLRKFNDIHEHDELIINNWNSVVGKKDTTYILGDVTMESDKDYYKLDILAGRKIVVLGNHDPRINSTNGESLLNYVEAVTGMVKYKTKQYSGKVFWLTHCPMHPQEVWDKKHTIEYNIHGHIHGNLILDKNGKPDKRYINVSAEMIGYTPRTLEELISIYKL